MTKSTLYRRSGGRRNRKTPLSDPTPGKLIEVAGPIFAERGYYAATVREICSRASVNVAAVNYHFGDKLGLYTAVLRESVRAAKVDAMQAVFAKPAPPEEMLRAIIKTRLEMARRADLPDWHFRIMVHELAQPTEALSRVVNEVARPVYERMLSLVGDITGFAPHDERTRLCAHSVMGQIMFYIFQAPLLERLWPEVNMTPSQMERIATHIAEFSLAYLRIAKANATSTFKKRDEDK